MKLPNAYLWGAIGVAALLLLILRAVPDEPFSVEMHAAAAASHQVTTEPTGKTKTGPVQGASVPTSDLKAWLEARDEAEADAERLGKLVKMGLGGFFSTVILAAALAVVFRKTSTADEKNWAFGALGAILGYWVGN